MDWYYCINIPLSNFHSVKSTAKKEMVLLGEGKEVEGVVRILKEFLSCEEIKESGIGWIPQPTTQRDM